MPVTHLRRLVFLGTFTASLTGVAVAAASPATPLVRGPVNDAFTATLTRDLPGALATSLDRGPVNAGLVLRHIRLALVRPAAQQSALDALTHDQYTRGSANYHRWLTPSELRNYGPAQADISAVVIWLTRHDLKVNSVSPSGMSIDFGGRARDVAAAFHTQLHNVVRAGESHVSTAAAPAIPAALAPVVAGVTLSNFFPKPAMHRFAPQFTIATKPPYYAVAPADFATIYNVNPLRTASTNQFYTPITGAGVSVALVEQTQILNADWNRFRSYFGLASYPGTLAQINPAGCTSPGFTGDEGEAALDTEWSSAVAPAAHIIEASCAGSTPFEFGVLTALQNLVEFGTPATIFSISYGGDEIDNGFGFEAVWTNLLEEGAAEGKAIFVSTGDSGVSTDRGSIDSNGLFVNGLSDSAYNVAVGGTDFLDTALGQTSTYWKPFNSYRGGSAISYVPETPWNNSCASSVIAAIEGFSGAIPFCNSNSKALANLQEGVGGSSSQSVYYRKPDWQLTSVLGMPNDGVRDQPDVSLFAANGVFGHFYLFCMSDTNEGGSPCVYTTATDPATGEPYVFGNAAGGTSFASPAFAGIAALVQQSLGVYYGESDVKLGNPAPIFYQIARAQFVTPLGLSGCNATLGDKISPACVFNYVTAGDNSEPCYANTPNCVTTAASTRGIGVLGAVVGGKGVFAYPAHTGYSLATGLGSVNVTNLLYAYSVYAP